jgi:hypothetical protein
MTTRSTYTKDPSAVLDYGFDWSDWLTSAGGDTISTSTWTATTGITIASSSIASGVTIAWLSGGTAGSDYTLTNRIVTAGARTDERSMTIIVRDR